MAEDSLITEELRSKVGVEGKPRVYEIEKGMIKRFARAVDDPNPLWQDEEYAKKSKYGSIIAPPSFIMGFELGEFDAERWHGEAEVRRRHGETELLGGTELECYHSIRPGDTITITTKLADVGERESKRLGKMLLLTYERTCKNQRQEVVVKHRQTLINYKIEGVKHD